MKARTFLHLSDIHFKKDADTPFDAYKDLRNELIRDAQQHAKEIGDVDGLLIGGDIAFSGASEEYRFARGWLKEITNHLGVLLDERVWVIPGNHDVDRRVVASSMLIQDVHANLRASAADVDDKLSRYLGKDQQAKKLIFSPIQNYVDFAAAFECDISADRPFWEDDVVLNDESTLRIRGINSTIVSDENDSDASFKLVLGKRQLELTRQDGVEYLVLCHHPPQWLLDQDPVEDLLRSRARIQLFGHKHRQRLERIDDTIRVASGAMHPDVREPNWQPRYNFIQVWIERTEGQRRMIVRIYPRVFSDESTQFGPEHTKAGCDYREYKLDLPDWEAPQVHAKQVPEVASSREEAHMVPARKLTYRFINLPHHMKLQIAQELGLVQDDDEGLRDHELYRRYFARAAAAGKLTKMWESVQRAWSELESDEDGDAADTGAA